MLTLLLVACGSPAPEPAVSPASASPPPAPAPPPPPAAMSCCADAEVEKLLAAYLDAQEKLAKDTSAKTELLALDAAGLTVEDVPTGLPGQRKAFKTMSDQLLPRVKASPGGSTAVREVYCPMYPGSWLQKGDTVANPYYGSAMLTCGTFK